MNYDTIEVFWSKTTKEVVVYWDDDKHPECTRGFYLPTLGM